MLSIQASFFAVAHEKIGLKLIINQKLSEVLKA